MNIKRLKPLKELCKLILIGIFCIFLTDASSQDLKEIYSQSLEAYENTDYQEFNKLCIKALELHPSEPKILYNLAASYSLIGEPMKSVEVIEKLISWNSTLDFTKDQNFANLMHQESEVARLLALKDSFSSVFVISDTLASLSRPHHIEDVFLISDKLIMTDVYTGEVLVLSLNNLEASTIANLNGGSMAIAIGEVDSEIWVSSAMISNYHDFKPAEVNTSVIYKIDFEKDSVVYTIDIPNQAVIGSMILQNGKLYATNSLLPEIIVIDTKELTVRKNKIEGGFNLQGITESNNPGIVYVADYIKGIARVDLATGEIITWLDSPNYLLKGIDGLTYVNESTLIAIQNNSTPKRVVKITHNEAEVIAFDILDNALQTDGEPTNGMYIPTLGYIYISNSPWAQYDEGGKADVNLWENQIVRIIKEENLKIKK